MRPVKTSSGGSNEEVVWVHLEAANGSGWYFWRQGRCYAPQETTLSEDERQELVGTIVEAHAGLREVAFKLRRELTAKATALKEAIRAEGVVFGLKRELQQLDLNDPEQAPRRAAVSEVRRGGKVVDIDRLGRRKGPNEAP